MRLTRTRQLGTEGALLLLIGVGTLAWAAMPGPEQTLEPQGAITGEVLDAAGRARPDVQVGLFRGGSLDLVELTRTDWLGRFAFQQAPATFHVLALPEPREALGPGWLLDLEGGSDSRVVVVLPSTNEVRVEVLDDTGSPVEDAEVRVYLDARGELLPTTLQARGRTAADGTAQLAAPPLCHLEVIQEGFARHYDSYWSTWEGGNRRTVILRPEGAEPLDFSALGAERADL